MRDSLEPVIESVDLLLAELRMLKSQGPHLRIVHRFREPGMLCAAGEEIAIVYLAFFTYSSPLTLTAFGKNGTVLVSEDLAEVFRITLKMEFATTETEVHTGGYHGTLAADCAGTRGLNYQQCFGSHG